MPTGRPQATLVAIQQLLLVIEGRTQDGRIIESRRIPGEAANEVITALLDNLDVDFLFLRHGEAGCHIARVDRSERLDFVERLGDGRSDPSEIEKAV